MRSPSTESTTSSTFDESSNGLRSNPRLTPRLAVVPRRCTGDSLDDLESSDTTSSNELDANCAPARSSDPNVGDPRGWTKWTSWPVPSYARQLMLSVVSVYGLLPVDLRATAAVPRLNAQLLTSLGAAHPDWDLLAISPKPSRRQAWRPSASPCRHRPEPSCGCRSREWRGACPGGRRPPDTASASRSGPEAASGLASSRPDRPSRVVNCTHAADVDHPQLDHMDAFHPLCPVDRRGSPSARGLDQGDLVVPFIGRHWIKGTKVIEQAWWPCPLWPTGRALERCEARPERGFWPTTAKYETSAGCHQTSYTRCMGSLMSGVPSVTEETFPLAWLEMIACSLPVVASRVSGVPEVINDGVTGWLIDLPNAVDSWVRDLPALQCRITVQIGYSR